MAHQIDWNGHTLELSGNWTWRWLFLAPVYELHIDGELVDRSGGPRVRPRLEAIVEDEAGDIHHIQAEFLSLIGFKPQVEVTIEEELVAAERVRVDNFLNPFLVIVILVSTAVMFYLGPDVIRAYWPG